MIHVSLEYQLVTTSVFEVSTLQPVIEQALKAGKNSLTFPRGVGREKLAPQLTLKFVNAADGMKQPLWEFPSTKHKGKLVATRGDGEVLTIPVAGLSWWKLVRKLNDFMAPWDEAAQENLQTVIAHCRELERLEEQLAGVRDLRDQALIEARALSSTTLLELAGLVGMSKANLCRIVDK